MAKKAFGKLAALLTIAGAAAAGISYLTKYRSFNKDIISLSALPICIY